jgi:tRNA acetyltransferase TAN1
VEKLKALLAERPEEFRYVLKVIPIHEVVPANLEEIAAASRKLASKIGAEEKFKVEVEKRYTSLHRAEIIEAVAREVNRKVDLKHPDKVLLIEVLGSKAGVSLLKPSDILSVAKEKI